MAPPSLRSFQEGDRNDLIGLWMECGLVRPWNDPDRDIARKLAHDPENLVVLVLDGSLVGAVMIGYDGHRGWANYLAVRPGYQGRGFGRILMAEVERRLAARGCPKLNLQVRASNEGVVAFYRHLGYLTDEVVSLGKRLVDDTARDI
jgi:ribosomal protein S18 acetylase RimI-like enzyme